MEKKIWSKQETKKFIVLYKENSILWNRNSADYRNLAKKRRIQNNLSVEFNTTVAEIARKIRVLRAQWLKEDRKMKDPSEEYESKWKWFVPLKPIFEQIQENKDEGDDIKDDNSLYQYSTQDDEPDAIYLHPEGSNDEDTSFMVEDCTNSNNDEYQIFGNYIAIKLRSMHNENNIQELKRLILQQIDQCTEEDEREYYSTKINY